jgi:hypothetical protein
MYTELQELKDRIMNIERLLEELVNRNGERDVGTHNERPLSMKQAADFLHLSISRMYGLIYEKKLIPLQRMGRSKILFSIQELNRFLNEKEVM